MNTKRDFLCICIEKWIVVNMICRCRRTEPTCNHVNTKWWMGRDCSVDVASLSHKFFVVFNAHASQSDRPLRFTRSSLVRISLSAASNRLRVWGSCDSVSFWVSVSNCFDSVTKSSSAKLGSSLVFLIKKRWVVYIRSAGDSESGRNCIDLMVTKGSRC